MARPDRDPPPHLLSQLVVHLADPPSAAVVANPAHLQDPPAFPTHQGNVSFANHGSHVISVALANRLSYATLATRAIPVNLSILVGRLIHAGPLSFATHVGLLNLATHAGLLSFATLVDHLHRATLVDLLHHVIHAGLLSSATHVVPVGHEDAYRGNDSTLATLAIHVNRGDHVTHVIPATRANPGRNHAVRVIHVSQVDHVTPAIQAKIPRQYLNRRSNQARSSVTSFAACATLAMCPPSVVQDDVGRHVLTHVTHVTLADDVNPGVNPLRAKFASGTPARAL